MFCIGRKPTNVAIRGHAKQVSALQILLLEYYYLMIVWHSTGHVSQGETTLCACPSAKLMRVSMSLRSPEKTAAPFFRLHSRATGKTWPGAGYNSFRYRNLLYSHGTLLHTIRSSTTPEHVAENRCCYVLRQGVQGEAREVLGVDQKKLMVG